MKFNSQICTTKEQSERLLALGLKKETADIVIRPDNTLIVINENSFIYHNLEKATQEGYLPAWSLHRLIEMVPTAIPDKSDIIHYLLTVDGVSISYHYFGEVSWKIWRIWNDKELYDNVIDCIKWLIGEGYFNKEYLDEL